MKIVFIGPTQEKLRENLRENLRSNISPAVSPNNRRFPATSGNDLLAVPANKSDVQPPVVAQDTDPIITLWRKQWPSKSA